MKKLEKYETLIAILSIIIYVVVNSYVIQNFETTSCISAIINIVLTIIIVLYIIKNKLGSYYGLTTMPKPKKFYK